MVAWPTPKVARSCVRNAITAIVASATANGPAGYQRPMQKPNEQELRERLTRLRAEHRDLDAEIVALETSLTEDQLQIKRLKKRKLALKDQITAVEDQLLPDIIA